jgi:tRNA-Thr(GGU) m(6)t(6)A37 methyltransferase TsaA
MSEVREFVMRPIGFVRAERAAAEDDYWGGSTARIELVAGADPEALVGLESFSHAEILFVFDRVAPEKVVSGARHPRGNPAWPRIGIFAQRGKARPNRIGSTIVRIVERAGTSLVVAELDAIDGTPVLDVKPVLREFLPRGEVTQPDWASELMREYWLRADA